MITSSSNPQTTSPLSGDSIDSDGYVGPEPKLEPYRTNPKNPPNRKRTPNRFGLLAGGMARPTDGSRPDPTVGLA
jgi:hypothetical protein